MRKFVVMNTDTIELSVPDIGGMSYSLKGGEVHVFGIIPKPIPALKIREGINGELKEIDVMAEYKKQEDKRLHDERTEKIKQREEKMKRKVVRIEDNIGKQKTLPIKKK